MTEQEFQALAQQGYSAIPILCEVLADLDTPLSIYLKLANGPYSYLFESVQGGEKWGRYSIIGLPCQRIIRIYDHTVKIFHDNELIEEMTVDDPLAWIEDYQMTFKHPELEDYPRFTGGLVGYFGYETIRYIEPKLAALPDKEDPLNLPDILLMVSEQVIVFDNLSGKLYIIVYAKSDEDNAYTRAQEYIDRLKKQMMAATPMQTQTKSRVIKEADFVSGFQQPGYEDAVKRVKQYITDGDAMQVVISQRMSIPFHAQPLDLYRSLRSLNPSPYMYYMDLGDFHIVGSSPEILVRYDDDEVTVRPIAGTRPRGKTAEEDRALEKDLLADPKELAEHLMLIDLGRNDVGRIAKTGSVELTDKMMVERYSHVMHIVSNVTGDIKDNLSAMDILRATFPAGTVSGAPKIRAMEIINELEPVKRGVYSGAVGYLGWNGNMDTAIAIRTAVIKDKTLHIQAGAGIVYDSIPSNEWDETMNKGRAVFRAVAMAEKGLDGAHK